MTKETVLRLLAFVELLKCGGQRRGNISQRPGGPEDFARLPERTGGGYFIAAQASSVGNAHGSGESAISTLPPSHASFPSRRP